METNSSLVIGRHREFGTRSEGVETFIEDMAKTKNVTSNETEKEFFRTTRAEFPFATIRHHR
jgi:hypothetical protein